jgi:alpha-glucosidase
MSNSPILHAAIKDAEWWRTAVIYQIYPRSFADGNGDGMGDLPGVTSRLHKLAELGVDAIWFSPFFKSPQKDAGYDVSDYRQIDPLFGTNEDLENLVKRADELGLRIIVDLVPNHTSDQHAWFQAALAAAPGSPARDMYIFKDGKGQNGELPPNNWQSIFGGAAWTRIQDENGNPGQWYLHLFDSTQPDLNWENPQVAEEFDNILRFWLDRGVAGFRIDVAHGMVKRHGLPDAKEFNEDGSPTPTAGLSQAELEERVPYWGQPAIHDFIRRFRKVVDEYDDRAMCAEASMSPLDRLKLWVRPDEYHQTFNFDYLETP